jgi:hypothetical protein
VNEGRQKRVEKASRSQGDADGIDDQCDVEVLKDNPAAVARDANGIDEFGQVVADQNDIGTLSRHIRPSPIATSTLASLSAGASLMPSSSMATVRPFLTCSAMKAVFCSGRSSE